MDIGVKPDIPTLEIDTPVIHVDGRWARRHIPLIESALAVGTFGRDRHEDSVEAEDNVT